MFCHLTHTIAAFVIFWTLYFTRHAYGEVVHIVGFSIAYRTSDLERRVEYQCYRSDNDRDAFLEFGRYVSTRDNETAIPPPERHSRGHSHVRVLRFQGQRYRPTYGVFYCQGSKPFRDVTSVLSFYMLSTAKFIPADDTFTKTVNIGDTGVTINMMVLHPPDIEGGVIHWRFNGSERIASQDNLTSYSVAGPVRPSDEGIYEVYYEGERQASNGALFRLIVRDCPSGKWGPPNCLGICDKCYNGGVCDDKSGLCICPNGFRGPNCLNICNPGGGNRFGLNCEFRCSYLRNSPSQCWGGMFCLPDPFGCTCDLGSKGLNCRVACFRGEYGAGCTQRCHCASGYCNIYTGECEGMPAVCSLGWSGENCQIPDVCDVGYYGPKCTMKCHCLDDGPCNKTTGECSNGQCAHDYMRRHGGLVCQACEGATFGFNCSRECRCERDACNTVTDECSGKCLENWLEPTCNRGVWKIDPNPIVNPGQPSNFTCHVYADPLPSGDSVNLYSDFGGTNDATGITQRSNSTSGSILSVTFDVEEILEGKTYSCMLAEDNDFAILGAQPTTYVLPVLRKEPRINETHTHDVLLEWDPWIPGLYEGDGPFLGYKVFYQRDAEDAWTQATTLLPANLSARIEGLDADTDYRFGVAGVREGPGGTGGPTPAVEVSTLCEPPNITDFGLAATAATAPQSLMISWQAPPYLEARCRSGFQNFTIFFQDLTSGREDSRVISFGAPPYYTLNGLGTYIEYSLYMRAANKDATSATSGTIIARTAEEIAPAPDVVQVVETTPSSVTLFWKAVRPLNLNGRITGYHILYRKTEPEVDKDNSLITVRSSKDEVSNTIENLDRDSSYSILVRVINGAGAGTWSSPITVKTTQNLEKGVANLQSSANTDMPPAISGAIAGLLFVVIVAVLGGVILYRRFGHGGDEVRKRLSDPVE